MTEPGAMVEGGRLNEIGRYLLSNYDYRSWALLSLLLLMSLACYRRVRKGSWPTLMDWLQAVVACLMLYTGLTLGCVFLLTKPIYTEALTSDAFALGSLITTITTVGLALRELSKMVVPSRGSEEVPEKVSPSVRLEDAKAPTGSDT